MMGDTRPEHRNCVWIVSGLAVSAPDEIEIVHGFVGGPALKFLHAWRLHVRSIPSCWN